MSDLRLYCILCSLALGIPIQLSAEKTDKAGGIGGGHTARTLNFLNFDDTDDSL